MSASPTAGDLTIPVGEASFDTDSSRDPDGRVFHWEGETLRAISTERTPFFRRLIDDGLIQALAERGLLISTSPTSLELEGYGLVVRHRTIPFVSHPTEWLPAMLRDAALLTLDLVEALAQHGLTLKDAHPWNVLFDGHAPVHVDLTSIVPAQAGGAWPGRDEFVRYFLRPLVLVARGEETRRAMSFVDTEFGARLRDLARMHPTAAFSGARGLRSRWGRTTGQVRALRGALERLDLPGAPRESVQHTAEHGWRAALAQLQPSSVSVLDAGMSDLPELAAATGAAVLALDGDASATRRLYEATKISRRRIHALPIATVADPGTGAIDARDLRRPARLRADVTLACGIPATLEGDPGARTRAGDRLHLVCGQRLLVEAPPSADPNSGTAAVAALLDDRFRSFSLLEAGNGRRSLVLCER